jgi:hypothetical protein
MKKKDKQPQFAQVGWIRDYAGVHPTLTMFAKNGIVGGPEGSLAFGYAIYARADQAMQAISLVEALNSEHPEYQIEAFGKPGLGPITNPKGVTRTITISGDGKRTRTVSVKRGGLEKS